jgi:ElaB/YqjD/DUF883 family membrane-anchored ribosome-binding protein
MAEDPNAIRADIADTRERLSNTIEEIGERLNPQVLKENVKDSIREATIGRMSTMARQAADSVSRTTSGVTATVRENPIPVAMVAVGLGWMIWNARANRSNGYDRSRGMDMGYGPEYGASYGSSYGTNYGTGYGASQSYNSYDEGFGATLGSESQFGDSSVAGAADRAKERARDIGDVAQRRAGEFADRARSAADTARDRAQHLAGDVKHRAQDLYGSAQDVTRRSAMRVEDSFQENPLAIGAVAMAIGLAAGLAAPVTDREVRWMGDARDDFVDRVKDIADETREKAEHVVSRVADEAKTAAREEGLTT